MDTSTWLTCAEASDAAHVSENTIRAWRRRGLLHPLRGKRGHPSGAVRELDLFDRTELAPLAAKRRFTAVPGDPGDLAASAFELFDAGRPLREVVIKLRQTPAKIAELHESWTELGGSQLVIGGAARAELERFAGPFEDVAGLIERLVEKLGRRLDVILSEETESLARASDAQVERAIVGFLDQAEATVATATVTATTE